MRIVTVLVSLLIAYVGVVVAFESLIGIAQPESESTIVLTTVDADDAQHKRVLSLLIVDEKKYVSVNHWPRAWWRRTIENPDVLVTQEGETKPHRAIQVSGEEFNAVQRAHPRSPLMMFLTGFSPRRIVRLDPV